MTNEEAIEELSVLWERMKRAKENGVLAYKTVMFYDGQYVESLDLAIEALERQPCEDCVSRAAALDAIEKEKQGWEGSERYAIDECHTRIAELPSVTPKAESEDKV